MWDHVEAEMGSRWVARERRRERSDSASGKALMERVVYSKRFMSQRGVSWPSDCMVEKASRADSICFSRMRPAIT